MRESEPPLCTLVITTKSKGAKNRNDSPYQCGEPQHKIILGGREAEWEGADSSLHPVFTYIPQKRSHVGCAFCNARMSLRDICGGAEKPRAQPSRKDRDTMCTRVPIDVDVGTEGANCLLLYFVSCICYTSQHMSNTSHSRSLIFPGGCSTFICTQLCLIVTHASIFKHKPSPLLHSRHRRCFHLQVQCLLSTFCG